MANEINDLRSRDHMANERTFLAWIRTNIGIMAFGFVIERFGLFLKQIELVFGKGTLQSPAVHNEYSAMMGILIVGFGVFMSLLAYINFKKAEKRIEQGTVAYLPSATIYSLLIAAITAVGIFLIIYLIKI